MADGGGPRIGIDLGGTKIEAIVLDRAGDVLARHRILTPRDSYPGTIEALVAVAQRVTAEAGIVTTAGLPPVGIGMPGSISPATGRVQNANSTWLNGRPLAEDLAAAFGQPVRLANDANCFALSEATDGAGVGRRSVFGVILGTGCGGGLVIDGRLVDGPRGIGGEWGHNPLPWPTRDEIEPAPCWCGRRGCMETWVSGPALVRDHARMTRVTTTAEAIVALAAAGDEAARSTLARHGNRLARGLAHVVNLIDPEVIVLGGGLSDLGHLYDMLPALMAQHIFADRPAVDLVPPRWGATSGVRGAAWLWP
jgi:fructokinase